MAVRRQVEHLREVIVSLDKFQVELVAARDRSEQLDHEWVQLSGQMALEQTPARALAETLSLLVDHIEGELCPVCNRDFSELGAGTLQEHVRQKLKVLEKRESLVAALMHLQARCDVQGRRVAELEAAENESREKRVTAESATAIGRSLEKRYEELAILRDTWIVNDQKLRSTRAELAKSRNADVQRRTELDRLGTMAESLKVSEYSSSLSPTEFARLLTNEVRLRLNALQDVHTKRIAARKACEDVDTLRKELAKFKEEREECERAHNQITLLIGARATLRRRLPNRSDKSSKRSSIRQ